MLKFILFLIVLFLAIRLAVRLVLGFLRGTAFFLNRGDFDPTGASSAQRSSGEIHEADYEVIESHLKDDKDKEH